MTVAPTQYFAVLHHIHDPIGWTAVLSGEHDWPDTFDLRSFVEANDHHLALCVWAAPSVDQLQDSIDAAFGHAAVNEICAVHIHLMQETQPSSGDTSAPATR